MHPAIRILCFLLFCLLLVRPDTEQLLLAALLVAVLLATLSLPQLRRTFSMVRRLRWLLLSVLVIYGWFTPGPFLQLPLPEPLWPSRAGLEAGLLRISILILILLAAGILLVKTSRQQLIAALYWLLWPLTYLRLSPERLAVRLSLTLDYVEQQQTFWQAPAATGNERFGGRLHRIARHLATLLPRLFEQAEQFSRDTLTLELLSPPSLIQWGWPLLLVGGFLIGAWIEL